MNPLHQLQALGQSVWYDNLRRALIDSGELARYLDDYAVTGVTSNPTIFEHAITGGDEYDDALAAAVAAGTTDPQSLFWELATADIRDAADVLGDVYRRTGGADGFVSIELPPRLTHDAQGAVDMGAWLHARIDRPNVMVKVTGTAAGVDAVEELVYRGVPVNITLLFSVPQWEAVAAAHARGLERRLEEDRDLHVASAASFFVSRIDSKANARLPEELHNRLAVANCQLAYAAYREWLDSDRWRRLEDAGAARQRLLWASTSAKDPRLDDTFYVAQLAAPDTINTMPDATLKTFAAHGKVGEPMGTDTSQAEKIVAAAREAGVELDQLGEELQSEGDQKFAQSFDRLLQSLQDKVAELRSQPSLSIEQLGPVSEPAGEVLAELRDRKAIHRLADRDHTLWQQDPTEVADRLGWLSLPGEAAEVAEDLAGFAAEVAEAGFTHALVLGMGGSSLFPMVVAGDLAPADGGLTLSVLDSIDPAAVRRTERELPLERTLVIASSKSGTTAETRALLDHFWERIGDPRQFAVITDPGTPLADVARERGMRRRFEARPDVGGRYAALSHYGLVPAALAGVDVAELAHRAGRMDVACADCVPEDANPALALASILAGAARAGRDKLTLVTGDEAATFGWWLKQLIAESTGKQGTGILPVVDEPLGAPEAYGDDRLFVSIGGDAPRLADLAAAGHPTLRVAVGDPLDLGTEVLRWEMAVALVGAALGVNPFDQPDVEAAKAAARAALAGETADVDVEPLEPLLAQTQPDDYVAIQAYMDPADPRVEELQRARAVLRDRLRVATTLGVGPRYLHSTGQLHKGGPNTGVFLQVVAEDTENPPIPGEQFGFADLKRAQAAGDLQALRAAGRRAARVDLDELRGLAG
jgi:transaldolase/glucose-6-phosphate isomerase